METSILFDDRGSLFDEKFLKNARKSSTLRANGSSFHHVAERLCQRKIAKIQKIKNSKSIMLSDFYEIAVALK